ncbi:MAG: DUF6298 domain-containing protein [Elusimicrobiota bacterium]
MMTHISRTALAGVCFCVALASAARAQAFNGPLRVDSRNPHFFTDAGGKSIFLTGTGIHGTFQPKTFGNPNYSSYLNFMVSYGHNLQRMRIWDNGWIRGDSSWAALPTIYKRTGPGLATDGKPKFDLNQFNDVFFTELRNRVVASRDKGIYVMLMFFMGYSTEGPLGEYHGRDFFGGHPYHPLNNINGINGDPNGDGEGVEITSLKVPAVIALQEAYIRKILDTLNDLDNIFYEIGNEMKTPPQFEEHFINYVRSYEAGKPKRHVVGHSASIGTSVKTTWDWDPREVMYTGPADWVASVYQPLNVDSRKVSFYDTDHINAWGATSAMVPFPWKAFTRGINTIFMDDMNSSAYGRDPVLVDAIRKRLGQTLTYSKKVNLVQMRPNTALASTAYCLASPGAEYIAYQPGSGAFSVNLLAGTYAVEWFNPATGAAASGGSISAVSGSRSFTPPFSGEAVLYLKSGANTPPAAPRGLGVSGSSGP